MKDSNTEWCMPTGLSSEAWVRRTSHAVDIEGAAERSPCWGLLDSARRAMRDGKLELARVLLERLVAAHRDSWKNPISRAIALNELAYVAAAQGDILRAERLYIKTQKIWLALSPLAGTHDGRRLNAYALFLNDYKHFLKSCANRSREVQSIQNKLEVLGTVFSRGSILVHIADANAMRGRFREARAAYEQAFRSATISGDETLKSTLMQRLSYVLQKNSPQPPCLPDEKSDTNAQQENFCSEAPEKKSSDILWQSYMDTAQICDEQERLNEAEVYYRKALKHSLSNRDDKDRTKDIKTLLAMALFYSKHPGKRFEADTAFKRALKLAERDADTSLVSTIRTQLDKFYRDYGCALETARLMTNLQASIPLEQTVSGKHMRLPQIPENL